MAVDDHTAVTAVTGRRFQLESVGRDCPVRADHDVYPGRLADGAATAGSPSSGSLADQPPTPVRQRQQRGSRQVGPVHVLYGHLRAVPGGVHHLDVHIVQVDGHAQRGPLREQHGRLYARILVEVQDARCGESLVIAPHVEDAPASLAPS